MLQLLVLTLISLLQTVSYAQQNIFMTKEEVVYHKILKNKPAIDKTYAIKLATVIVSKASKHNISASKYTAILAQ